MTAPLNSSPDGQQTEAVIAAGMASGDTESVMRAVATAEIVVPQAASADVDGAPGRFDLAARHRAGRHVVRPRLHLGVDDGDRRPRHRGRRPVNAAELAANWPDDELWLAVNPGTEDGLTLPPDAVRSLPTYVDPLA